MSAWWLVLPAALGICAVIAVGAALVSGPKRAYEGRHLAAVSEPEPAPEYGSMCLDAERDWYADHDWFPEGPIPQPDWREQTAADLSPAVLDGFEVADQVDQATADRLHFGDDLPCWCGSTHDDSGPGVSSLVPPGPVQDFPEATGPLPVSAGIAEGALQVAPAIPLREETRLADTGDIRDARLLAERIAELRARDDDVQAFMSAREAEFAQARHDLAKALT